MTKTPAQTSVSSKFGAHRGLKIALAVSLMLNLAVAGAVLGSFLGTERGPRSAANMSDIGMGPFTAALPDEIRKNIGKELVNRAGSLRENRRVLQEQFDEMLAILRAESFDMDKLSAITDAQYSKLAERQEIGRALLYAQLAAMSPDERRAYADRLEDRLKRGRKQWPREEQSGQRQSEDHREHSSDRPR